MFIAGTNENDRMGEVTTHSRSAVPNGNDSCITVTGR